MNNRGSMVWILWVLAILFISGFGLFGYQEYTSEYKYTAIIPCYDKYGNEIIDLVCEREVSCGWGQNYDNDDLKRSYPCDKEEYDGEFVLGRNQE